MGKQQFYTPATVQSLSSKKQVYIKTALSIGAQAGGTVYNTFFAPEGHVAHLRKIRLASPGIPNATLGDKTLYILLGMFTLGVTYAESGFSDYLSFNYEYWDGATSQFPANLTNLYNALRSVKFDEKNPLTIGFTNGTDVIDTSTVDIYMYVELEKVK